MHFGPLKCKCSCRTASDRNWTVLEEIELLELDKFRGLGSYISPYARINYEVYPCTQKAQLAFTNLKLLGHSFVAQNLSIRSSSNLDALKSVAVESKRFAKTFSLIITDFLVLVKFGGRIFSIVDGLGFRYWALGRNLQNRHRTWIDWTGWNLFYSWQWNANLVVCYYSRQVLVGRRNDQSKTKQKTRKPLTGGLALVGAIKLPKWCPQCPLMRWL